ncbi:hypothetical protein CN918_28295 [Priestia megaterium]|nr:hypothetical protein CN918_28295 [Priestia megaterium]
MTHDKDKKNDLLAQSENLQKSLDEGLQRPMSQDEKKQFFYNFNRQVNKLLTHMEAHDKEVELEIQKHKNEMEKIMEDLKKDREKYNGS